MKTIYLVRHAKTSQDVRGIKDWERPLTVAGIDSAQKVAKKLYQKKINPDKMISSPAFRAINTALLFAATMRYTLSSIKIDSKLYENTSDIMELLKKQDDTIASIMLFGHNPSISNIVNQLTGKKATQLSTSAVTCIQFKTTKWTDITKNAGEIIFTETGK